MFNIYISSFEVFLTIRVPPTIGVPFKDQQVWMTLGPQFWKHLNERSGTDNVPETKDSKC